MDDDMDNGTDGETFGISIFWHFDLLAF